MDATLSMLANEHHADLEREAAHRRHLAVAAFEALKPEHGRTFPRIFHPDRRG